MKRFLIVSLVLGLVMGGLGIGIREVLSCDAGKDYFCSWFYGSRSVCCYGCGYRCLLSNGEWGIHPYYGCTIVFTRDHCEQVWRLPCSAFC